MSLIQNLINDQTRSNQKYSQLVLNLNLNFNNFLALKSYKFKNPNFFDLSDEGTARNTFSPEKHLLLKAGIYFVPIYTEDERYVLSDLLDNKIDCSKVQGFIINAALNVTSQHSNQLDINELRSLQNFLRPGKTPASNDIVTHAIIRKKMDELLTAADVNSLALESSIKSVLIARDDLANFCVQRNFCKKQQVADKMFDFTFEKGWVKAATVYDLIYINRILVEESVTIDNEIDELKFVAAVQHSKNPAETIKLLNKSLIGISAVKEATTILTNDDKDLPKFLEDCFVNPKNYSVFNHRIILVEGENSVNVADFSSNTNLCTIAATSKVNFIGLTKLFGKTQEKNQLQKMLSGGWMEEKAIAPERMPFTQEQKAQLINSYLAQVRDERLAEAERNFTYGIGKENITQEEKEKLAKYRSQLEATADEEYKAAVQKLSDSVFLEEKFDLFLKSESFSEKEATLNRRGREQYKQESQKGFGAKDFGASKETSPSRVEHFDSVTYEEVANSGVIYKPKSFLPSESMLELFARVLTTQKLALRPVDMDDTVGKAWIDQLIVYLAAREQTKTNSVGRSDKFARSRAFVYAKNLFIDSSEVAFVHSSSILTAADDAFMNFCEFYSDSTDEMMACVVSTISFLKSNHHVTAANLPNTAYKLFKSMQIEKTESEILDFLELQAYYGTHPASTRVVYAYLKYINRGNAFAQSISYRLHPDPPNSAAYCNLERFINALEQAWFFEVIGDEMGFSLKEFKDCMEIVHEDKYWIAPYSKYLYGKKRQQRLQYYQRLDKYFALSAAVYVVMPQSSISMSASLRNKTAQAMTHTIAAELTVTSFIRGFTNSIKQLVFAKISKKFNLRKVVKDEQ